MNDIRYSLRALVAPTDPLSLTVAPVLIALAAIAACVVPVRRATSISRLGALRAG